jgi:DNA-binding NarL/FixJ family response regulator
MSYGQALARSFMKILLVDDHTLFRDGVALILKNLAPDYETIAAGSCEEGLAQLAGNPDTALVLLDLGLPDVSGDEAIRRIRQMHPDVPVVVLSGSGEPEQVLAAVRAGAMGFIPKSHSPSLLIGALTLILVHKGIYLPPEPFVRVDSLMLPKAPADATQDVRRICTPPELGLTARQGDVLYHVLEGKGNKVIARELGIEEATVRSHVTVVLKTLRVTTRAEAIIAANRLGLVFAEPAKLSAAAASHVRR